MQKISVKSSSHYHFFECPGADTLAVVFSARNDRPPKFTFWKTASALNAHIIFLNSDVPEWYRDGIPDIKGGIRGAAKEILDFKARLNAKRLVMIGSSMGAYGALLYGHMTKADEVLAFGVEPLLGVPGGKTDITRNQFQYMYPDLTHLSLPPTTVFYGGLDKNDILGAWLLRKRRNANIICIPESQHDTPDLLALRGQLSQVMEDIVAGHPISNFGYGPGDAANDDLVEFLWQNNNAIVEQNWPLVQKKIEATQNLVAQCPLLAYLHGVALFRNGKLREAAQALESFIQKIPCYWEAWMNLGAINLRLGKFEEAIQASLNSIKLRPHRSITHMQLSNIYLKAGHHQLAFDHAEWACKLNQEKPEYYEALKKVAPLVKGQLPDPAVLKQEHLSNIKAAQSKFGDDHLYRHADISKADEMA